MSFLKPGVGELVDRLTIVHLKIKAAEARLFSTLGFVQEFNDLRARVVEMTSIPADDQAYQVYLKAFNDLLRVNQVIWYGTNEQQNFGLPDNLYADVSRRVVQANKDRAQLVRAINAHFGRFDGDVKFYE